MQSLPAWLFMLAAIATGVMALIPYLALCQPSQSFSGDKDPWIAVLDSQTTGIILFVSTMVMVLYAVLWGDWSAFAQEFMTNRFIHGMSLALFCFVCCFPTQPSCRMTWRDAGWRGILSCFS